MRPIYTCTCIKMRPIHVYKDYHYIAYNFAKTKSMVATMTCYTNA